MKRNKLFLFCCLCAVVLFFPSCNNDDESPAASEFFIEGKVDGEVIRCDYIQAGLGGTLVSTFGVHFINLIATVDGGGEIWSLMIQSTELPDNWNLPKTFEGSIIDPFSDNVNGAVTNSSGMTYGPLDPILCGMDWDWQLTVTSWENNIIEGNFSGSFYAGDCDPSTPAELESVEVTEGRFRMEVE
ncbi:MAG: hypothetical protein AAFZ15_16085 [Bacteroidota bacterium]